MQFMPRVSVVIVDYFKADRVLQNVRGALGQVGDFQIDIVVVDNSCDEGNKRLLGQFDDVENVTVVYNDRNAGYTQACNQGAALSGGDYIFLVNPDIVWKSSSIVSHLLEQFRSDTSVVVIGTRQENDDGTTPDTVRSFPNLVAQVARRTFLRKLPWFKGRVASYEVQNFDYSVTASVDWVQSSFMVVRGDFWTSIGGLDTNYFLFMSDPDICYKAWERGSRVLYMANIVVGADGKRCSAGGFRSIITSQVIRWHILDAIRYQLKYLLKSNITLIK